MASTAPLVHSYSANGADGLWHIGTIAMLALFCITLAKWLGNQQTQLNAVPVWIIPVIGLLTIPIIGSVLRLPGIGEINIFYRALNRSEDNRDNKERQFSKLDFRAPIQDS